MVMRGIFDDTGAERSWGDARKLELLLHFLEQERRLDPLIRQRFQRYLDEIVDGEDMYLSACDRNEE